MRRKTGWKLPQWTFTLRSSAILPLWNSSKARFSPQMQTHIDQHPNLQQQRQLLESIPGIASDSAARMLGELGHWQAFEGARQLAAYAGITPQEKTSGTSAPRQASLVQAGQCSPPQALVFPGTDPAALEPGDSTVARGALKARQN